MKIAIFLICLITGSIALSQKHIFSLGYSNQIGINQFNSIQNESHNNDKIKSGYSYKNIGLSFERKISERRNLWIDFSMNIWDEEYRFDYYYLFRKPDQDPFNYLTEEDFKNLPERRKSSSYMQMVDFKLGIKKTFETNVWGLEIQPELGLYTKSDFGLVKGFQYASILIKMPYYYSNITRFATNSPENNNNVFLYGSLSLNKTVWNKFQIGLKISYLPRIKLDYTVSTVVNVSTFDDNGESQLVYFKQINDYTQAQLVYDLFRFGLQIGYKF